jgi:hypothetical protein
MKFSICLFVYLDGMVGTSNFASVSILILHRQQAHFPTITKSVTYGIVCYWTVTHQILYKLSVYMRMHAQNCMSATIFGLVVSLSSQTTYPLWQKLLFFYDLFRIQTQDMLYCCSPLGSNEHGICYIPFLC